MADAKRILKSISDYLAAQDALSFDYDATLEVVTFDGQKLALASSGSLSMKRPDKLYATRAGGFADTATSFDGKTLTILGKNENLYTQVDIPGTIDNLVDELRFEYNRPLPAADLLLTNAYDEMMNGVTDIKDLDSAVIGGVECDYLAFRTKMAIPGVQSVIPVAEARVGRPLTPVSVAGVARRTVRRCAVGVYNC